MLNKIKSYIFGPDYSETKKEYENRFIDLEKIKRKAEKYHQNGDFYCSESVVKSFIEEFDLDLSDDAIAMASSFPVGMGHSGCSCGAVVSSQMMIGYFFGRRNAGDSKVEKAMELSARAHDYFREKNGCLCCRVLTKDYKIGSKDHRKQCVKFTGEMAYYTAEMICNELDINYIKSET